MTEAEFFERVLAGDLCCNWEPVLHNLVNGVCVDCGEPFGYQYDGVAHFLQVQAYVTTLVTGGNSMNERN